MQSCIHKIEGSNLLLMAPTQNWRVTEQIPVIEGTPNLPHVLNLPYSNTGELWGALLYLSPSLMYSSYNHKQLLPPDLWLLYFHGHDKYFEKLSVLLKTVMWTFTAKYNINPSLMVRTSVSICDSTHAHHSVTSLIIPGLEEKSSCQCVRRRAINMVPTIPLR